MKAELEDELKSKKSNIDRLFEEINVLWNDSARNRIATSLIRSRRATISFHMQKKKTRDYPRARHWWRYALERYCVCAWRDIVQKLSRRGSGSHANQFQVKTPDRTTPYIYQLIVIITQVCLYVSIEESVRDKSTRNTRSPLESDSTLSEMTLIVNCSRYSSWKKTCQWIKVTTISKNMTTERRWSNWKIHRVSKLRKKYSYPMIHKTWNKTRGTFGHCNLITTVDMKRRKTRTLKNCSNYPVLVILSCFDVDE